MSQDPPKIIVEKNERETSSGSDHELAVGDFPIERHSEFRRTGSSRAKNEMSGASSGSNSNRLSGSGLDRKESYKAQRKNYRKEKKRVEKELLSTFKDETIIVLADWLKVRGSLKSWTKLWCILKPGLLLLYRSQKSKSSHWIGTIILSACELIERPSKKDGFCFKLFHPMDQSIWASKGPEGESLPAFGQPLPTSHLIFRAPTNAAGKCWMDALELALRCSSLLTTRKSNRNSTLMEDSIDGLEPENHFQNDSDVEKHFKADLEGDTGSMTDEGEASAVLAASKHVQGYSDGEAEGDESDAALSDEASYVVEDTEIPPQTNYVCDKQEVFGTTKDQTEEFSEENKSIVWFLMKQVRPGMDLSRVVLPTFILEPRSFLDKLSDYYYHADLISKAAVESEPFMRMKTVVQWYLSGFYKKPKGLKKPYNPILGETFRCYWEHPNGSKTFYLAEQVSHHPPISSFYTSNREDGFTISGTILAKSKFYGNSTSAILEGVATLTLLSRGEDYVMTMPYAHCKGILMGTMTMELGGKVTIGCDKTGYNTELEFKLRPFLGGGEFTNAVTGRIKLGSETLAVIDGHWDEKVTIKNKKTGIVEDLWQVTPEIQSKRLPRYTVPFEDQTEWESAKLWEKVSAAIADEDQVAATDEKTKLEEEQRAAVRLRKEGGDLPHKTKLFEHEGWAYNYNGSQSEAPKYTYKQADIRPWDTLNDLYQYEHDYVLYTKTRHKTPMIRTSSIVSVLEMDNKNSLDTRPANRRPPRKAARDLERCQQTSQESDASNCGMTMDIKEVPQDRLADVLKPLVEEQKIISDRIGKLNHNIEVCLYQQKERDSHTNLNRDMVLLVVLVVMIQAVLNWVLTERANRQQ